MNREIRPLVTYRVVKFKKHMVQVHDFRQTDERFRRIYGIYFKSMKENLKISTWNRLDFRILGSRPVLPKSPQTLVVSWFTKWPT